MARRRPHPASTPKRRARRFAVPQVPVARSAIERVLARFRAAPTRFALLARRPTAHAAPRRTAGIITAAAGFALGSVAIVGGEMVPGAIGLATLLAGVLLARSAPRVVDDLGPRWNRQSLLRLDQDLALAAPALSGNENAALERIRDTLVRLAQHPRAHWRLEDSVYVERLIERHLPQTLASLSGTHPAAALHEHESRLVAIEARLCTNVDTAKSPAHPPAAH
jgi:hypothetical protein